MTGKLCLALSALFFLLISCSSEPEHGKTSTETQTDKWVALKKGVSAKPFVLKDLDGREVSLSEHRGKIVFLNFWATWCPPCRQEMPSMEALHKKLGGKDFVILALANDRKGLELVKPFAEEKGITFTVLIDDRSDVSDAYGVVALPTTFIIDREGVIIEVVRGGAEWDDAETVAYFEELIKKKQAP